MIYKSIFISIDNDSVDNFENIDSYKLIYRNLNKSFYLSNSKWNSFLTVLKVSERVDLRTLPSNHIPLVTSMVPKYGKEVSQLIARTLLKIPSCNSIEDVMQIMLDDQHFVERIISGICEDKETSKHLENYTKELNQLKEANIQQVNDIKKKALLVIQKKDNIIEELSQKVKLLEEDLENKSKDIVKLNKLLDMQLCDRDLLNQKIDTVTKERDDLLNLLNKLIIKYKGVKSNG